MRRVGVLPFSAVVRAVRRRGGRSRRWEAGKSCPCPLATAGRVLASWQSNEASNLALERTAGSHPLAAAAQRGVRRIKEAQRNFDGSPGDGRVSL